MPSLTRLFRLLELTRAMPQYGYVLAEIPKGDISDLAQHHYLVTIIAWQLGRLAIRNGATLNLQTILEICLVHDLGELFGGDIAFPYSQANPAARPLAKQFEAENFHFIAHQFDDIKLLERLGEQSANPTSNEGLIAKIADYLEVCHYRAYVHRLTDNDIALMTKLMRKYVEKITDSKAHQTLTAFLNQWSEELPGQQDSEFFEDAKQA